MSEPLEDEPLSEDEIWAEIEGMMTEEFPEMIQGFNENYSNPTYHTFATDRHPLMSTCERCGATIADAKKARTLHNNWHRALSLRIHTQMAIANFIFGLVDPRKED